MAGVSLSWPLPQEEDLNAFVVERSETPVGNFVEIVATEKETFVDPDISQGRTYFYRIRSRDRLGNLSIPSTTSAVTVPRLGETVLPATLEETLVPGVYRVEKDLIVPGDAVFQPSPGVRLRFAPDAGLIVRGRLELKGTPKDPIILEGLEGRQWKGIRVTALGLADIDHVRLRGCMTCVDISGGKGTLSRSVLEGPGDTGVNLQENISFAIRNVRITDFHTGVRVEKGEGSINNSTITHNEVGLDFIRGVIRVADDNLYSNKTDATALETLVLEGCYLGAENEGVGRLSGQVIVKDLLDAPYPHGRKVVISRSGPEPPIAPQADERSSEHKAAGMAAYNKGDFKAAQESLSKALSLKPDNEVFRTLAYAQMSLKEPDKAGATLEKGIEIFPDEPGLYPLLVQYLVSRGETDRAMSFLRRGLALNPDDENLKFLEEYLKNKGGN